MRPSLAIPDEKKTAAGYTGPGSGVPEVERPWGLQPVYQPDPRVVFRYHSLLTPVWFRYHLFTQVLAETSAPVSAPQER